MTMQVIYANVVCFVTLLIIQATAHVANITKRQAPLSTMTSHMMSHSTSASQSSYPDNPIMLESPSHFAMPHRLRKQYPIEAYIVGGYNKWGGYDREMFQSDGSVILEFDMKITREEYSAYYSGDDHSMIQSAPPLDSPLPRRNLHKSGNNRVKRKALFRQRTHWPGAVVPYHVSVDFLPREVQMVRESMKTWEDRTCIRFVPAQAHHRNILLVQGQRGCNSFIGMVGGRQELNLEKDCRVQHVIVHELGHVIGLIHEHQRPDRDNYIRVLTENVGFNKLKNFRKFRGDRVSQYGVDYDYNSIMHYGKQAFSKDDAVVTMATVDTRFQDIIGHATTISFSDAKVVNLMYGCARSCGSASANICGSGYMNHKCQCVCKDGTQSCVQRRRPIRRPLTKRIRRPRPSIRRNVMFPGVPRLFKTVLQPSNPLKTISRGRSMIRNIFQPNSPMISPPMPMIGNRVLSPASGNIPPVTVHRKRVRSRVSGNRVQTPVQGVAPQKTPNSVIKVPVQAQKKLGRNLGQTLANLGQILGQTLLEDSQTYGQNEPTPKESYDTTFAGSSMQGNPLPPHRLLFSISSKGSFHFHGILNNQGPLPSSSGYLVRSTQWDTYPSSPQSMMMPRNPAQSFARSDRAFWPRHVINRKPYNIDISPGYIAIQ